MKRFGHYEEIPIELRREDATVVAIMSAVIAGTLCIGAVSYTHLDVYKRQDQGGVQGLVAVRLGDRDVVLELPGNRLEQAVQRPEREVARRHVVHDDAEAVKICLLYTSRCV